MFDPSIGLLGNLSFRKSFKVTMMHPDESGRIGTKRPVGTSTGNFANNLDGSTGTHRLIHAKSGVAQGWSPDF